MLAADLPVPAGFVLTVAAYLDSMDAAGVRAELARLHALALAAAGRSGGEPELADLCTEMRDVVRKAGPSPEVVEEIHAAYRDLGIEDFGPVTVAVRSSALGEDGAAASFAGMHSSFTNVRGADALLAQVLECWASTVAPRAIVYRAERGITTEPAVAVEPDTYTFSSPDLHLVSVRVGNQTHEIVQGRDGHDLTVTLDHERATSRVLDDQAAEAVARMALRVEAHFGAPQDVEWAMIARQVWLVQARPITTLTGPGDADRKDAGTPAGTSSGPPLVAGLAAAPGRAIGRVRVLHGPEEGAALRTGEVLVAPMTDPDWLPTIRRAAALVTDQGGSTCHAAIVARELGVPCVVGTREATSVLPDGRLVVVDGGSGEVLPGAEGPLEVRVPATVIPRTPPSAAGTEATATRLYVNLAMPDTAEQVAASGVEGWGCCARSWP
jgi:pyruvate,water dikinase